MADGQILRDGFLISARIYKGEDIAIQYPDGTTVKIPSNHIYMVLRDAFLPDGEPCHVLYDLSPITRLPIVILDNNKKDEKL